MSQIPMRVLAPYGNVIAAREVEDGVHEPGFLIANVYQLGVQPQATVTGLPGAQCSNIGQTIGSVTSRGESLFSMASNAWNEYNLALALLGTTSVFAGGSVSETGVPIDLAGGVGNLPHTNVGTASLAAQTITLSLDDATGFVADDLVRNDAGTVVGIITLVATNDVTIWRYAAGWTPAVGDTVTQDADSAVISAVATATVALTENTDFTYSATDDNQIAEVAAGLLIGKAAVVLNYDRTAPGGVDINILELPNWRGKMWVLQKNQAATGTNEALLNRVTIAPNQVFNLLNAPSASGQAPEFTSQTWGGNVEKVTGLNDIYRLAA